MDCDVQLFWVRWTESKYRTACSDTLSLSLSLPLSHYFKHCLQERRNLLKWLFIYISFRLFTTSFLSTLSAQDTNTPSITHTCTGRAFWGCKSQHQPRSCQQPHLINKERTCGVCMCEYVDYVCLGWGLFEFMAFSLMKWTMRSHLENHQRRERERGDEHSGVRASPSIMPSPKGKRGLLCL